MSSHPNGTPMTEKEKAANGWLYDANYDKELLDERLQAKKLLYQYNLIPPGKEKERMTLLQKLLGKCPEELNIEPPFYCDYGYNIEIGNHFFANMNLVILDGAKVTFGENVFIAPNVALYTAGHPFSVKQRNAGLEYAYPIHIGDNVWIGGNVVILPGVTIGDNCVIGAGSIVTGDIPANTVAYGNPCRVVRSLTKEEI